MKRPTLYLVDDDPGELALLTAQLERDRAFTTEGFTDPARALERVLQAPPDGVVCDLVMPDIDGREFTRRLRETHPTLPIIIATGGGSERDAARCFEAGATDFVTKPVQPGALVVRVRQALRDVPARELLREASRTRFDPHGIVGRHPRIRALRTFIEGTGDSPPASAILSGETGTGKNLVARAIHAAGDASDFRYLEVHCADFSAPQLAAELFGYEQGAFPGAHRTRLGRVEEADGGTLLLDEIGAMPLQLQARILSVLETGRFRRVGSEVDRSVDLRVLATTTSNLRRRVGEGRFLEGLFERLERVSHELPPLRAVVSDIPELVEHFAERGAEYFRMPAPQVELGDARALFTHGWPGNVRELRNVVERALIYARAGPLTLDDEALGLPSTLTASQSTPEPGSTSRTDQDRISLPLGVGLEEVERRFIRATIQGVNGNIQQAADTLGVTRKVLWLRRKKLGMLD